ncbi:hypothetical protein EV44_g0265 [Erysiphe necator]|uniref:Uncharacterized protein n=1 Tax=Uncinula necator TaxID=52586 RepID=A0A0B1PDP9_UNCNE|nr:hypothetical protein EV44_g0265 [Erysiphe necator]
MLWYTLFVITIWISNIMAATFTETKTITVSACSAITTLSSALSSTASNLGTIVPSVLPSAISTESIIGSGILPSIILSTSSVIPSSENLAPALTFTSTVSSSSLGQSSNPSSNTVPTSILPPVETQSLSKASQGLTSTPITGVLPATEKSPTETESMKTIIQGSNTSAASLILPTPQASSGELKNSFVPGIFTLKPSARLKETFMLHLPDRV